ncbi:hypothetical protein AX16_003934 [Volvariella volvacea WC 439]|nr:hypothetical protein AX16_003934 [Volvariella volvacea WC 439]
MGQESLLNSRLSPSALLSALALSWFLYGCSMIQFYIYYTTSARSTDPPWLRNTVNILCILEGSFTAILTHSVWVFLVDSRGVIMPLPAPWTASVSPAIIGIETAIVQVFLARRIWKLSEMSSKSFAIALVIVLLASIQATLSLVVVAQLFQVNHDPQRMLEALNTTAVSIAVALACDIIITLTMITLLWRAKGTIAGALNSLMKKLIIRCFETGAMVTITALGALFLFVTHPFTHLASIAIFSVTRLYAMTMLASLNARKRSPPNARGHISTVVI